jgi:cysteine synthase
MKIEIQGQDAVEATKELLAIEGLEGSYQTINEVEREGTLATIATIVGIVSGTLTIAESIHKWKEKYQKSLYNPTGARVEKVLIVTADNNRLLLKDATVEQIQEILEKSKKQ